MQRIHSRLLRLVQDIYLCIGQYAHTSTTTVKGGNPKGVGARYLFHGIDIYRWILQYNFEAFVLAHSRTNHNRRIESVTIELDQEFHVRLLCRSQIDELVNIVIFDCIVYCHLQFGQVLIHDFLHLLLNK